MNGYLVVVISLLLIAPALAREFWMKNNLAVIGNLTLQEFTLPGTHDSASYSVTDQLVDVPQYLAEIVKVADFFHLPVGSIIDDWSKSQNSNIFQQLVQGIRYLDLRVTWDDSNSVWKTHHGPVVGTTVEDVLSQIKSFVMTHSSEVLVLELSHQVTSSNPQQNQILLNAIESYLGQYLWPHQNGFNTINSMIQSGKTVLLTMTLDTIPSNIWPASTIINSYANSPILSTMEAYNLGQVQSWQTHGNYTGQLYKISWTLTPDADTILESLLPDTSKTLIDLANVANNDLSNWFGRSITPSMKYPYFANILIIDNFSTSPIVQIVQKGLNFF
eukprot:TRINITY_DN8676_c0_g1_i1.p1 TRINITY_DN8676_c0_g1~~TRINITY_DN8676_c0_g1_i1.p1  ORF type:complete len:331 (+),score=35.83 TRINITY_DN8676_c0_g1_i1:80-1072(+)